MTAYSDVPQINALYQQRELITRAIAMLDDGGSMTNMTIRPRPDESMTMMSVMIAIPPPTPPDTVANIRAVLVTMQSDIDSQLAALGVTDAPEPAPPDPPVLRG